MRDELLPAYLEIGPSGRFAVAMMRADLDRASKAMIEGDTIEMIRVYESLKGYTLRFARPHTEASVKKLRIPLLAAALLAGGAVGGR